MDNKDKHPDSDYGNVEISDEALQELEEAFEEMREEFYENKKMDTLLEEWY